MRSSIGGRAVTGSDSPVPRLSHTISRTCRLNCSGLPRTRSWVVVEIDVADPTRDQHHRDVPVAHLPIGQPNVPVSRIFDATDAHAAKCVTGHRAADGFLPLVRLQLVGLQLARLERFAGVLRGRDLAGGETDSERCGADHHRNPGDPQQ